MQEKNTTEPSFVEMLDLMSSKVGGTAMAANDEFFAPKENLVNPHPAEWREGAYTDRGKWMDGWESRRRRADRDVAHDWCLLRLGIPGMVSGVVVDTAFFRGNYPASCSIEYACIDEYWSAEQILDPKNNVEWKTLLPRANLQGHTRNCFAIDPQQAPHRVTHVRLNMFPDGGIARLRIHGTPMPAWAGRGGLGAEIDLAASESGAVAISCSDMFFSSRHNLIAPGLSAGMHDGWETKRRRGPGHDWAIVKLAGAGQIGRVEVDTSHFKGNAPGSFALEWCHHDELNHQLSEAKWLPLMDETSLLPNTRHFFADGIKNHRAATHIRLNIFPDGGVARLRVWGKLDDAARQDLGLKYFNAMFDDKKRKALSACCGSNTWVEQMLTRAPFASVADMRFAAEDAFAKLTDADWQEAFHAHPRIGQRAEASSKHGAMGNAWSQGEQQGMQQAVDDIKAEMQEMNVKYDEKFGHIFITCATGKTATEMLQEIKTRINNSKDDEAKIAAAEQKKITAIRMTKLLNL